MTKILIVEDNLDYAEDMAEFLVELEHEVHITSSAGDMWAALSHGNVDVVVLDLGLPDEDGFNVIPRMRQLYPQIGVLVLTGRVAFDSRILGLRLGADHYLTKPIKFPELAAHIEALDRRVRPLRRRRGEARCCRPAPRRRLASMRATRCRRRRTSRRPQGMRGLSAGGSSANDSPAESA